MLIRTAECDRHELPENHLKLIREGGGDGGRERRVDAVSGASSAINILDSIEPIRDTDRRGQLRGGSQIRQIPKEIVSEFSFMARSFITSRCVTLNKF